VLVPVGKVDVAEVEGAATRAAKVLRTAIALREPVAIPKGSEDAARGQHDAPKLLMALRGAYPTSKPSKMVGTDMPFVAPPPGAGPGAKPAPSSAAPPRPSAQAPGTVTYVPPGGPVKPAVPQAPSPSAAVAAAGPEIAIFLTDVDLFAGNADGIFTQVNAPNRTALLSVRRLREAFYKRKADPAAQRARVVKQILKLAAQAADLPECRDPKCALSPAIATAEIDRQPEHYCANCWKRLSQGAMRV